jgi:hypothetical protein
MDRRKLAQIRAIDKAYRKKANAEARAWIVNNYGVTYEQYVEAYGFKGSATCLRSHLAGKSVRTIQNMIRLQNYLDVLYGSVGGKLS